MIRTASARLVRWLAYVSGSSARQVRATASRRIVMLHGVGTAAYPAEMLDEQLGWLAGEFEVIAFDELVRRHQEGEAPSGAEIVLTFDDGLRNNATVAAPLLEKHGLPAAFFVCPGLIEDEAWLWNCDARERLLSLRPAALEEVAQAAGAVHGDAPSSDAAVEQLIDWMKTLGLEERDEVIGIVHDATPRFRPTDEQRLANDVMSWDELRALDPARITIGSHTVDHPLLPTLDDDDLNYELGTSREMLEQRLDREVPFFCYPNGAQDERVCAAVRRYYDAAVTTEPGLVQAGDDPHRLPRVGATPSAADLAWRLHRP